MPDTDLVGTDSRPTSPKSELAIETPTDQLQASAVSQTPPPVAGDQDSLIGDTMTPFAFEPEPYDPPPTDDDMFGGAERRTETPSPEDNELSDPEAIPRLSSEEVQAIEQRMLQPQNYLSDDEKRRLIEQMDKIDQPFSNTPIVPPKRAQSKSDTVPPVEPEPFALDDVRRNEAASKPPRYAYYYRNWIQLTGSPRLHDGDNLQVSDNAYVLKAKTLSTRLMLLVGGPVAAVILFLIAVQMVGTTGRGSGSIAGLVVDEYSRPYIHGALVRVPDLGKNYQVNPQGFFVTDELPAGTHRLEYLIDGEVIGVDQATVVGDKISTITLRPSEELLQELAQSEAPGQSSQPSPAAPSTPTSASRSGSGNQAEGGAAEAKSAQSGTKTSSPGATPKKSSAAEYAKLTLKANVDGAKLSLDGSVVGAGNLTFSRLTPGKHKYSVSADGYETVTGTITLAPAQTNLLAVDLIPLTQTAKQESYGAEDFYYSGATLLRDGDITRAVEDLTEAIRLNPSYAEAYSARGSAYTQQRRFQLAHDDHLRAAEIHRMRKDANLAITEYNNALKADDRSVAAHMGRASLFMAKGEPLAAIADYESVIRLDRGNFDAYFGLGEARYKRSNYKSAINHFKDARSLQSNNPLVHQYLMLCYLADNDIKNVNKSYEKFIQVASQQDVDAMRQDSKYAAVLRVVEKE